MSRLTDLRAIFQSLSYPWAWSRITVAPEAVGGIERARANILDLIWKEEEALEREQAVKDVFDARMEQWRAAEPVKPWREDLDYEAAKRAWQAAKPVMGR